MSELVSTCLVLRLADQEVPLRPVFILPVVIVATVHIVVATKDQFLENVIRGEGYKHQVTYLLLVGLNIPSLFKLLLF